MNIRVLNKDLHAIAVVDVGEALIWTDRYQGCGDIELTLSASNSQTQYLKEGYYLLFSESMHGMIIESAQTTNDIEYGNKYIVRGRSLESILDRRIAWTFTNLDGGLQDGILQLLDENFISPDDPLRTIDNLTYEVSTDPAITALEISEVFDGTEGTIYDAILSICRANDLGFRIVLSEDNQFVFSLYSGADRTYDQIQNPFVVFSPGFGNLNNSNFYSSIEMEKTVTVILVEDDTYYRVSLDPSAGAVSGLDRKEILTDGRDITRYAGAEEPPLTNEEFLAILINRGVVTLLDHVPMSYFDGEMVGTLSFTYNTDFFMGDVVQVTDDSERTAKSRITEMTYSEYEGGIQLFPTFTAIT